MKIKKKSQEEMVGFVLIIVLVVVIGLIFLVLSLRKPSSLNTSEEINSFLHASSKFTTSCQKYKGDFYDLSGLISACSKREDCFNGTFSCTILNETINTLINSSFKVGEKYKGYYFKAYQRNETLFSIKKGNETNSKVGGEISIYTEAGNIKLVLELYY